MDRSLLDEQIAYYRARAAEYDEWFLRQGRYDRGEAHRRAWFGELAGIEAALAEAKPRGRILELACGTGLWTRHLVQWADELTALDSSPEVLQLNAQRLRSAKARHVQADIFNWKPDSRFDFIFFGFWLSHVPPDRFESFWAMLKEALAAGGKVFFVDNTPNTLTPASNHRVPEPGTWIMERFLNDGRQFQVVKIYHEPAELQSRLEALGWRGYVKPAGEFFYYGCMAAV